MVAKAKAQSVQQVVRSSIEARNAGAPDEALRLIEAALVEFPDARALHLQAALNLHKIGDRLDEELAHWNICFDSFKEESSLPWFHMCRAAIQWRYRLTTDPDQVAAQKRLVDDLHAKCRAYLIDPAQDQTDETGDRNIAREATAWIAEWDVIDQGTPEAFARHFVAYPNSRNLGIYRKFVFTLFQKDPATALSKFVAFEKMVSERFPIVSASFASRGDEDTEISGRFWLEMADVLMHVGAVEHARRILLDLPQGLDGRAAALTMNDGLLARLHADNVNEAPDATFDDPDENGIIKWSPATPSDTVIFVFTGMAQNFYFALPFFHKFLGTLGCHIVYLKDSDTGFFLRGESPNGPSELEHILRGVRDDLGAIRCYTLGSSSGGYAAVRFGIALGADGILAFSIPTVSPADVRLANVQMMFQGLQRDFPDEEFDLVQFCANAGDIPPITLAFGEKCVRDRTAAEKLAGFPQVRLQMAPGSSAHPCIKAFVANGSFFPMIERMIS